MLKALNELLERALSGRAASADEAAHRHTVELATAALLIEVVRSDYQEDLKESGAVFDLLKEFFRLTDEETTLLVKEAEAEADHAASLQAFTRRLHEELAPGEKHEIVEMLWKVALADRHLDKHEDHLIRKVAGLLYVSHADLIRIRNRVKGHR
jgi:uncharacterized tellurite resistance protein B-like protein